MGDSTHVYMHYYFFSHAVRDAVEGGAIENAACMHYNIPLDLTNDTYTMFAMVKIAYL